MNGQSFKMAELGIIGGDRRIIYLDYNATTPLEPEVLTSIQEALSEAWGNPSSSHEAGKRAKATIDLARKNVADMIGADPSEIIFTSGGTEANNMILQSAVHSFHDDQSVIPSINGYGDSKPIPHIISSHMEHPAVTVMLEYLENTGKAEVTYVPLSKVTGQVEVKSIVDAVKPNTVMISVMLANNETGIIQPLREISDAIKVLNQTRSRPILIHTDTAQVIGKIPVNVQTLCVDYLTVVGHKFYGPRIGALYARGLDSSKVPLYPMLFGGGQERNFRPGTENTGMIAGLGKACEIVTQNLDKFQQTMEECRNYLEEQLQQVFPSRVEFNGKFPGSSRLPNTCNVSISGENLAGHTVLSRCKRLQASVGAACHAQNKPSPILLAVGVKEEIARNAIRLSLGRYTTKTEIDTVVSDLKQAVDSLL